MDIKQALKQLNPKLNAHWTSDGAPRLEIVSEFLGVNVTREQVIKADPFFTRESMLAAEEPADGTTQETQEEEASTVTLADDLIAKLKAKQGEIDVAGKHVDEAQGVVKKLASEMDVLAKKADKLTRSQESFKPFADYLESQKNMRIERAALHNKALEATRGLNTSNKSPLDNAFTRKNTRGAMRPQVPLKTGT